MELFKQFLLEAKATDLDKFLGFAKERWKGNFEKDTKLITRMSGSDLLDFLGDHIKGGFNREKFFSRTKLRNPTTQDVIKVMSKKGKWNQFTGPKSFKGF